MFKDAKIGDKVWSLNYGWGVIKRITPINTSYLSYPISVAFNIAENIHMFTIDGKFNESDKCPTLFWNSFEIPKEAYVKPLPNLKVDTN